MTLPGIYSYKFAVTDNLGSSTYDTINITVYTLIRGPYLQKVNSTSLLLRWRTDIATASQVEVGTVYGTYEKVFSDTKSTSDHVVLINGLLSDTKYYYRFGNTNNIIQSGNDNYFITAPNSLSTRKMRFAAFGDCGRNDNGFQSNTLSAYLNYTGNDKAEVLLLLGDNAYDNGLDSEYQTKMFNVYSSNILKNHALFPAPGNHDYANTVARQVDKKIPYYDIFSTPANAECGGVASLTSSYYSFNWGNVHFLSLDSYGFETTNQLRIYDTMSPQIVWLKNDLEANLSKWTVVYFHHPPYTMGSHNSDTEAELISIRQKFTTILERYGVDLVLNGHSHDYERSYLLKGYTGDEASFNLSQYATSNSSGKYDGSINSCAFQTISGKVNQGTIYVVSGSSGAAGTTQAGYPHNALPFAQNDGGMFYFEVEDNRLDGKFIRKDGVTSDQFTIMKDVSLNRNVSMVSGSNQILTASWIGNYKWSNGATTRSITINSTANSNYTCSDIAGCINDNFNVTVTIAKSTLNLSANDINLSNLRIYPVPLYRGEILHIILPERDHSTLVVSNSIGQNLFSMKAVGKQSINTTEFKPGIYFLKIQNGTSSRVARFVVMER